MLTDTLTPVLAPRHGTADRGLHETTALIAAAAPDLPALRMGELTVGYGRLDATADAWAADLVAAGAERGAVVPILLPRGVELVTALLAVLKTGAAYALLDPGWPAARLAEAVAALPGTPVLIAPPGTAVAGLPVWTPPAGAVSAPAGFRPAAVGAADPCCVFFTSGTTGAPKPVLVPHQALARLFPAEGGFAEFGPRTVVPLAAPMPWDAFALELWGALGTGGTSVVITEPYLGAGALREAVARHAVNTVWLTASLFNMIVDEDIEAFDGVRQVMTGGERLSPEHVRRFLLRHRDVALLNGYGPVENTVFATTARLGEADCDRRGGVPLGVAVPGTGVHVLDGDRACAVGETGEICVSGSGLALGYLNDPELTAAKFAHVRIDGRWTRVYRTGDLGVLAADGVFEFHGRADRQVKIRGNRIEPEAVERQIRQALARVRDCRVLARRGPDGTALDLVAFCRPVTPGDRLEDAADLLRPALVAAHRPAAVISLDAFPVTDRGKLDERALLALAPAPAAAAERGLPDGPVADPLTEVERAYREVLGLDAIPRDVPFTELGGDSLRSGRVCARLGARLDRPVPLSAFHAHPSVRELAAWLEATARASFAADAPRAHSVEVALSPMQLVYLTRSLLEPDDLSSTCLLVWSMEPAPDPEALAEAIAAVHARHEPLRSIYTADPRPTAIPADVPAPELLELPRRVDREDAEEALLDELAAGFDLEFAEVWRTALIRFGDGRSALFGCAVHHIAFDGWSESVFAADLGAAYRAAVEGRSPLLTPAPPSATVAEALAERRAFIDIAAQCEQRAAELADVPALRWPDAGDVAEAGAVPEHRATYVSPAELAGVDALAASCGTTRFVVLLGQFAASLAEVTGQDDFALGVPTAQRDSPLLTEVIGCHIATLCVRLSGSALTGDAAAIRETAAAVSRASAAQDVPLADLMRRLNAPRTSRPPLYQAMFALQDNASARLDLPGIRTALRRQHYLDLPLELHAELWPGDDGGLTLVVSHRPDAVPDEVAAEVAARFADRLRHLPGSPSTDPTTESEARR